MKVLVKFVTRALGDTVGGMPAVLEFQRRGKHDVSVDCGWTHILKRSYPSLTFLDSYDVRDFDRTFNINYHFDLPLQEGLASDLGMYDWVYMRPVVDFEPKERPVKNKYVTIGIQTTSQSKYWNYPDGWDVISRMFRKRGITPVCIDQHESFGIKGKWNIVPKNSVKRLNNSIEDSMNYIHHSEFFLGVSSGLSWLAHALGKKVVMISGVTLPWNEFDEDCVRVINTSVCHGCFHESSGHKFDAFDWMWCPLHKGTPRHFECTTSITPEQVMREIELHNWI